MPLLKSMEIDRRLSGLPGWNYKAKQIEKLFELSNFREALDFVVKIGEAAEHINHHPDIFIHSWNKVKITISTHSEGGVTEKDFILAKAIERINDER